MTPKTKIILIIVVVGVIAAGVLYFQQTRQPTKTVSDGDNGQETAANAENAAIGGNSPADNGSLEPDLTVPAPEYPQTAEASQFSKAVLNKNNLMLTAEQLALVVNVTRIVDISPALLAATVEDELQKLDPGELETDVDLALGGVNTSVGIGQVRISTAESIEKTVYSHEAYAALRPYLTARVGIDEAARRDLLVKRVNDDAWNLLYAATYLLMMGRSFADTDPIAPAIRYRGYSGQTVSREAIAESYATGAGRFLEIYQGIFAGVK